MSNLSDVYQLFSTQPDLKAAEEVSRQLCHYLRSAYGAQLAIVFLVKTGPNGEFFRAIGVSDKKGRTVFPDAQLDQGLIGISRQLQRPVLVRDPSRGNTLSNLITGESIPNRYYRFDSDTDENLVVPLFRDGSNGKSAVCGALNLERNGTDGRRWDTSDVEAIQQLAAELGPILYEANADEERRERMRSCIRAQLDFKTGTIRRAEPTERNVDALIVCALKLETEALVAAGGKDETWNSPPEDQRQYRAKHTTYFSVEGQEITVATVRPSNMGLTAAAVCTTQCILQYRPRIVILTGIAAGVKGRVDIGDVLVPNPSYDYRSGKIVEESGRTVLQPDAFAVPIAPELAGLVEDAATTEFLAGLKSGCKWEQPPNAIEVRIGTVGAADQVVNAGVVVSEAQGHARNLIGLDMESYAVYFAAREAPCPRPLFIAFKSVSDFAVDKKDQYRPYAAHVAAGFTRQFLRTQWKHLRRLQ